MLQAGLAEKHFLPQVAFWLSEAFSAHEVYAVHEGYAVREAPSVQDFLVAPLRASVLLGFLVAGVSAAFRILALSSISLFTHNTGG